MNVIKLYVVGNTERSKKAINNLNILLDSQTTTKEIVTEQEV